MISGVMGAMGKKRQFRTVSWETVRKVQSSGFVKGARSTEKRASGKKTPVRAA
jgi:hypothetical protein